MSDKLSITPRQAKILRTFEYGKRLTSAQILSALTNDISIATLKRDLVKLGEMRYIIKSGGNRDSGYGLTDYGLIHRPYELGAYYLVPESERNITTEYNFDIFQILSKQQMFSTTEISQLDEATEAFKSNSTHASHVIHKKELERFVIDLSWKSSKIEGNTYTLLETERLIKEGLKKNDRSEFETAMILNHKRAYDFLLEQMSSSSFELSRSTLEKLHSLVVDRLGVATGLRKSVIGISGSLYRPLSLIYQIEEQLNELINCINTRPSPYEKSLIAILGESYLQPFEDGNKRTARMLANALLLQSGFAPLSYRTVDEQDYKEATLIFYEQNSIEPFKKLFIEQYVFAANNYNIATNI